MPTTYILDTHGLLYQLFHALPPMSSPKGEPVGAVYGFTKDIFGLIARHKPDYLFCAFDLPGQAFRFCIFAALPKSEKLCRMTFRYWFK